MKKLTFIQANINNALSKVGITVPSRPLVPVCEMVNIKTRDDGKVTLFTSDTKASTCVTLPYEGDGDVEFNVNYKDLYNFIKNCKEEEVMFRIDGNRLEVLGKKEKVIFTVNHEPHLSDNCHVEGKHHLSEHDIEKMYKNLTPFTATDQINEAMTGILLDCDGKKATCVSTNSHTLSIWNIPSLPLTGKYIVTKSFVHAAYQFMSADLTVDFDERNAIIESGSVRHKALLIGDTFPNYKPIVDSKKSRTSKAKFNTAEMLSVVNKSLYFCDSVGSVCMKFGANNVKIISGNLEVEKEYDALIDCENNLPQDYTIWFNGNYLSRVLSLMDGEETTVLFGGETELAFFEDGEDNLFIIVPKTGPIANTDR